MRSGHSAVNSSKLAPPIHRKKCRLLELFPMSPCHDYIWPPQRLRLLLLRKMTWGRCSKRTGQKKIRCRESIIPYKPIYSIHVGRRQPHKPHRNNFHSAKLITFLPHPLVYEKQNSILTVTSANEIKTQRDKLLKRMNFLLTSLHLASIHLVQHPMYP